MNSLRKHVIAVLAAASVASAGLAAPPPASAMPYTCEARHALYRLYASVSAMFGYAGDDRAAAYWPEKPTPSWRGRTVLLPEGRRMPVGRRCGELRQSSRSADSDPPHSSIRGLRREAAP
jgi:hypothetical protein